MKIATKYCEVRKIEAMNFIESTTVDQLPVLRHLDLWWYYHKPCYRQHLPVKVLFGRLLIYSKYEIGPRREH